MVKMVSDRTQSGFSLLEMLFVVALIGLVSAMAVPMFGNTLANFRLSGDARSAANAVSLTKMRAASDFSRVRLYVDLDGRSHRLEAWDKTASHWTAEGGNTSLSTSVSFGFGVVGGAPPNTQATIGQAAQCKNDAGTNIGNTACIIFNSRGVPVDSTGAPTAIDALYVTDGTAVYGITVSATGMVRTWRTLPRSTPTWVA